MSSSSQERILFIAGGTDGIGFSLLIAECKRCKYSKIYVLGRNFDRFHQLKKQLLNTPSVPDIVELLCDITQQDEIKTTLSRIKDESIHDFILTIGTFHRGKIADITHDDIVANHFHLNCISTINLIRSILTKLVKGQSQILVCTASLAVTARSPYGLQSCTKAALRSFIDILRIELKGTTRVMNIMPPSVDTRIFSKAGDHRNTCIYPPPSRVVVGMQYMLDCPFDICIPELLIEQHQFDEQQQLPG
jgi:short-subunit dehydrogenase